MSTETNFRADIGVDLYVTLAPADQFEVTEEREGTFRIIKFRVVAQEKGEPMVMNGRGYVKRKDDSYNVLSERNAYVYWHHIPTPLQERIGKAMKEAWNAHWMHKN